MPCSRAHEPAAAIAQALKLGFATRVAHPLGDIITVPDKEVSTLNYLRNNVLHAYALPALVANLLVALARGHAGARCRVRRGRACPSCARN